MRERDIALDSRFYIQHTAIGNAVMAAIAQPRFILACPACLSSSSSSSSCDVVES